MTHEELMQRLQRALTIAGDIHALDDILKAVNAGDMQSFAEGDTWVITQVNQYPKKKVLDIMYLVGNIDEAVAIYRRIIDFACEQNCSLIRAFGRIGWARFAEDRGWTRGAIYYKEID